MFHSSWDIFLFHRKHDLEKVKFWCFLLEKIRPKLRDVLSRTKRNLTIWNGLSAYLYLCQSNGNKFINSRIKQNLARVWKTWLVRQKIEWEFWKALSREIGFRQSCELDNWCFHLLVFHLKCNFKKISKILWNYFLTFKKWNFGEKEISQVWWKQKGVSPLTAHNYSAEISIEWIQIYRILRLKKNLGIFQGFLGKKKFCQI